MAHKSSEDVKLFIKSYKLNSKLESDLDLFTQQKPKWKLKFRKFFLVSESNIQSQFIFRSRTSIRNERRRQVENYPWYVIHPFSKFRTYWEIYMLVIYSTNFFFLPFYMAFLSAFDVGYRIYYHVPLQNILLGIHISFILDLLSLIDVLVNFLTGYHLIKKAEIILQPGRIVKRYVLSYFLPDLLSSMPWGYVYYSKGIPTYLNMPYEAALIFRVFRCSKFLRIGTALVYYYRTCEKYMIPYFHYKLMSVIALLFYLVHWMICLSIIVPVTVHRTDLYQVNKSPANSSWLRSHNILEKDLFEKYIFTLYRVLRNIVGVGFSLEGLRTLEDQITVLVIGMIGRIHWLYLLVVFVQSLKTEYAARTKYWEILDQLKAYMEYRRLPLELRKKLLTFYAHRFQNYYLKEEAIRNSMSENLRKEISMHTCRKLIERVDMFKNLPTKLIAGIVSNLKSEIFLPGDIIVRAGAVGDCMYFVLCGTVAVFAGTGEEICHLHDGDYFGEIALFLEESKRIATVIAVELSELYRLKSNDFINVIMPHQEIYFRIEKIATQRFEETLKMTGGDAEGKPRRRRRKSEI